MRVETIGDATLYLADCRALLPTLGKVDAVVTDPPYGINYIPGSLHQNAILFGRIHGDDSEFSPVHLLGVADFTILWGANNYAATLPRGGWLCWDKRTNEGADNLLGSPFELAWCSNPARYKIARIQHGGAINADGPGIKREHPTQKPIALMGWCIEQTGRAESILDPYMGSGTTGVAAIQLGRKFIGIEREERYFEIACRRISQACAQGVLFAPEPPRPVQLEIAA